MLNFIRSYEITSIFTKLYLQIWILIYFMIQLVLVLYNSNYKSFKGWHFHCVKSVRIWSYSSLHFSAFRLNTERYWVSLCIQSKCGKMRTRITPNMGTFYAVFISAYLIILIDKSTLRSRTRLETLLTNVLLFGKEPPNTNQDMAIVKATVEFTGDLMSHCL